MERVFSYANTKSFDISGTKHKNPHKTYLSRCGKWTNGKGKAGKRQIIPD